MRAFLFLGICHLDLLLHVGATMFEMFKNDLHSS